MSMSWPSDTTSSLVVWLLLHSLWQAGVLAGVSWLLRRGRSPRTRHAISMACLGVFLISQVVTAVLLSPARGMVVEGISGLAVDEAGRVRQMVEGDLTPRGFITRQTTEPYEWWRGLVAAAGGVSWLVLAGWVVVCGLLVVRQMISMGMLWRQLRVYRPVDGALVERFEALRVRMGVRRPVRYLTAGWVDSPATAGWLRPVILLPEGINERTDQRVLDAFVLHELSHIRRGDSLSLVVLGFASALYFMNPALGWLRRQVAMDRELCCDQMAVAVVPELGAERYAQALVDFARGQTRRELLGLGGGQDRGGLVQRVKQLLVDRAAVDRPTSWSWLVGAVGAAGLLLLVAARPLVTAAELDADLRFIESQSFPKLVLDKLGLNRPNEELADALAEAILVVEAANLPSTVSDAPFEPLTGHPAIARLMEVLARGAPWDMLSETISEVIPIAGPDVVHPAGWRFGTGGTRSRLGRVVNLYRHKATNPDEKLQVMRARIVYHAINGPWMSYSSLGRMLAEPETYRVLKLDSADVRVLLLARDHANERRHRLVRWQVDVEKLWGEGGERWLRSTVATAVSSCAHDADLQQNTAYYFCKLSEHPPIGRERMSRVLAANPDVERRTVLARLLREEGLLGARVD